MFCSGKVDASTTKTVDFLPNIKVFAARDRR